MRFGIWTPLQESAPHAGVRALWRLGRELTARGHDVAMWMPGGTPPECDVLVLPERTAPTTKHERTVRWVLLHGGQRNPADRLYTWSPAYIDAPELRVPIFDLDELCDMGDERHGTAVWIGKGTAQVPLPEDARPITYDLPRAEVLTILRTSTSLLSFDAHSAVNTEATLCGTPVHLPLPRPDKMPPGDDYGFRWTNADHLDRLGEARPNIAKANIVMLDTVNRFEEDMLAWT